jgi:hypothetical protein
MPHLCFYSEKCRFSQSFIEEVKRAGYLAEFKFICVDPDASGKKSPIVMKGIAEKWLTAVPTLIIDGETGPRTDAEVFNWLSMKKLQEGRQAPVSPDGAGGGAEPVAYGNELASGKWSDSYSFFGQQFEVGKGQGFDPIPRNFGQLQEGTGNITGIGGKTAGQVVAATAQKSKKELEMDSIFEKYQRERDKDTPNGFPRT